MPAAALGNGPMRQPPRRAFKTSDRKELPTLAKHKAAGVVHRYAHGFRNGGWRIWERETGRLAWSWAGPWPEMAAEDTAEVCRAMNGVGTP